MIDVDGIAAKLAYMADLGRSLPPAWEGDRIATVVCGPQGQYIGKMLPGKGLYLDMDLKYLGLNRSIPYVFEKTRTQRIRDRIKHILATLDLPLPPLSSPWYRGRPGILMCPERGAITTYDGIISARAGGKANDWSFSKTSFTTVANIWFNTFRAAGLPQAGTYTNIPGGAAPDRTNVGALSQGLYNPTNPNKKYLLMFGWTSSSSLNMGILADLLVAAGNINANLNTSQTVNSVAQTRQYGSTLGSGVMMNLDVTTALGATPANFTASSYTNQGGTAAQTSGAHSMTISAIAQRVEPSNTTTLSIPPFMQLASGDFGVRSVETCIFSAAMGAGVVALNLFFPLMWIPGIVGNVWIEKDTTVQIDSLTELVQASGVLGCLMLYVQTNGATLGQLIGSMKTTEG